MDSRSITLVVKKTIARFTNGEILDWFYVGITLCLIGGIIFVSLAALTFLLRAFNTVVSASDKELTSESISFNIVSLRVLAPRFGIVINDTIPLSLQPEPTQSLLTPLPMPSISPLDISEISLRILNGTGVPGLANKWKKWFAAKGLRHVTIGNAPTLNEKEIMITYKSKKDIFLPMLRDILKENTDMPIHEQPDDDLSDDFVIIIGK